VAVKIRLKRMGAKKRPFYRVVVADARSPRDGRFIESVGYYDPLPDPAVVKLDGERIRHWMGTGAKPSDVVRELLERQGLLEASPRPVRAQPAAAAGAAEAVAGDGPQAPAEGGPGVSQEVAAEALVPETPSALGNEPEADPDQSPAFPAEPGEA